MTRSVEGGARGREREGGRRKINTREREGELGGRGGGGSGAGGGRTEEGVGGGDL